MPHSLDRAEGHLFACKDTNVPPNDCKICIDNYAKTIIDYKIYIKYHAILVVDNGIYLKSIRCQ